MLLVALGLVGLLAQSAVQPAGERSSRDGSATRRQGPEFPTPA
jgi:hypothetical protein